MKLFWVNWIVSSIFFCLCINSLWAEEGTVMELLEQATLEHSSSEEVPSLLKKIDRIIAANLGDPEIDSYRLYRIRAQKRKDNLSQSELLAIVKEFQDLAGRTGFDSEVAYLCNSDIGYIQHHYLQDSAAALIHYKEMESHSIFEGSDLETEYRKVDLYAKITVSAGAQKGHPDDVEKYAQLVMAYPYLGMEDRAMYAKFYELYREAAIAYIGEFHDDLFRLQGLTIYPSQQQAYKLHQEYLTRQLDALKVDVVNLTDIQSGLSIDTTRQEQPIVVGDSEHVDEQEKDTVDTSGESKQSGNYAKYLIILFLIPLVLVIAMKKKNKG